MTLSDLFDRLDWSRVRDDPDRWYKLYTTIKHSSMVDEDYFKRFWCNVIHCAFYGEDRQLQQTAAQLLLRAGMWDEVVSELKKAGLVEGVANEQKAKEDHQVPGYSDSLPD